MYKGLIIIFQVWFKNRRAKWRKTKREEEAARRPGGGAVPSRSASRPTERHTYTPTSAPGSPDRLLDTSGNSEEISVDDCYEEPTQRRTTLNRSPSPSISRGGLTYDDSSSCDSSPASSPVHRGSSSATPTSSGSLPLLGGPRPNFMHMMAGHPLVSGSHTPSGSLSIPTLPLHDHRYPPN